MNEAIILFDFSENFSFIIQGKSQGFHWENSICTAHPFVFYHEKSNDDEITIKVFAFYLQAQNIIHLLCTLISALMPKIKCFIPKLSKIYYYSDGCTEQYKNIFGFINLCYHKCEWHFFATLHGKVLVMELEE